MTYIQQVADWLKARFAEPAKIGVGDLNLALRVLAVWRSRNLAGEFRHRHGPVVFQGPFEGMTYVQAASEGALLPRLIGTYEQELHPAIRAFAADPPDCLIDVGCAEGYYAVGLARLMPQVMVHAHDIDAKARTACADLAERNGVADRVKIGGLFSPADFQAFGDRRCLVVCDIEGAEDELLRPDLAPALRHMSLIVECHEVLKPGLTEEMLARFSATHDIERFDLGHRTLPLPGWIADRSHMDRLIAVWEWRSGPTPWLVMRPKAGG